jgi:D-glycero-D-manno-heptose 1,7-bisphosphate phosphatase
VSVVLVDRDGTVNVGAPEGAYVTDPADVRLLHGAGEALARITAAGMRVAVVTNQRGVALGLMSLADVESVNRRVSELLDACGARVDGWFVCPHDVDSCTCRKPRDGLVRQALTSLDAVPAEGVIIGDRESDVLAGEQLGLRRILLAPQPPASTVAHLVVTDLSAAVDAILTQLRWD